MPYYAVFKGRKPGVYTVWLTCHQQIHQFKGAIYKKFTNEEDAKRFSEGETLESINESNKKNKILMDKVSKLNPSGIQSQNKKLDYVYFYNYPGFQWTMFRKKNWKNFYYIFTDGSRQNKAELQFKGGFGAYFPGEKFQIAGRNNQTHNYCEIESIVKSLEKIIEMAEEDPEFDREYIIVSDSQYCVKSITQYFYVWKEFGWKKYTGQKIHNVDKWKYIYQMLSKLDRMDISIGFMHVRSHRKQPKDPSSFDYFLWYGNSCADRLALGKQIRPPAWGYHF